MLVEPGFDERALRNDLEPVFFRVVHESLDECRRDAVAAQCLRYASVFSDDGVDAELAIGELPGRVLARDPGLVTAAQP